MSLSLLFQFFLSFFFLSLFIKPNSKNKDNVVPARVCGVSDPCESVLCHAVFMFNNNSQQQLSFSFKRELSMNFLSVFIEFSMTIPIILSVLAFSRCSFFLFASFSRQKKHKQKQKVKQQKFRPSFFLSSFNSFFFFFPFFFFFVTGCFTQQKETPELFFFFLFDISQHTHTENVSDWH